MINETNVKCFLSLSQTLSFTKTANELYMTQQAVSKNISKMEESFGFPLFQRSHHGVTLTQNGEQFYSIFSRFQSEYDAAVKQARRKQQGCYRVINVGYQNWLDFGAAPSRALSAMRQKNSDLYLVGERHSPVILTELLMSHKMDLIMLYDRFAPRIPGILKRVVTQTPAVLMVSPDNPLISPDATYKTFVREPFIFDSFENEKVSEINERAQRDIAMWGLKPRQVIIMPNRDSAYTAAELGRGVIISTQMNRITNSSILKKYSVGKMESIVCIWRAEPSDHAVEEYVDNLIREYQNI